MSFSHAALQHTGNNVQLTRFGVRDVYSFGLRQQMEDGMLRSFFMFEEYAWHPLPSEKMLHILTSFGKG